VGGHPMTTVWHAVTTHERSRTGQPPEVYATEAEAEAAGQRLVLSGKGPIVVWPITIEEDGA
jgi:hypothetical protein